MLPLLIAACGAGSVASDAGQSAKKSPPPSKPQPAAAPAAPTMPFLVGESLDYSGEWLKMNGSVTAHLGVIEQRSFFGKPAWHFQAQLHTNNPLRYIIAVDDQFDSYDSATALTGLQFEMYLHESGKTETDKLRLSSIVEETPGADTVVKVLPGTRDPIAFAYYLRTVDWQKTSEVRGPVYDGHKLYDVRANLSIPKQSVTVAAGTYTATGIAARVFENGAEMTSYKIILWLAQDATRTPVLITVDLPVGTGRIELVRASEKK